jgi:hypothetical protein
MPSTSPCPLRILGHQRDAPRDRVRGRGDAHFLAVQQDAARRGRAQPEQRLGDLGPARADQSVEPHHLAAPHLEADVLEQAPAGQAARFQRDLADLGAPDVARHVDAAPDHQLRHRVLVGVARLQRATILAVAQNADAVGDLEDLLHPVRDVDDPDTLAAQIVDHLEQHDLLGVGQRRGRFVEDHRLGVHRQGARDLDHLLVRNGQIADQRLRLEANLQPLQDRPCLLVERGPVHPAEASTRQFAQIDVLGHAQLVGEAQFLVDEHDAHSLGMQRIGHHRGLLADVDRAFVGLVQPAQHLHQGRLAGAVLAHQGMDLAGHHGQRHAVERAHPGEGLDDPVETQCGGLSGHILNSPLPFRLSVRSR